MWLRRTAPHCMQCSATHCKTHNACLREVCVHTWLQRTATYFKALQRTALHCTALHRTARHCNALHRTATYCKPHTARRSPVQPCVHTYFVYTKSVCTQGCNVYTKCRMWLAVRCSAVLQATGLQRLHEVCVHTGLQRTATYCNVLQHTYGMSPQSMWRVVVCCSEWRRVAVTCAARLHMWHVVR